MFTSKKIIRLKQSYDLHHHIDHKLKQQYQLSSPIYSAKCIALLNMTHFLEGLVLGLRQCCCPSDTNTLNSTSSLSAFMVALYHATNQRKRSLFGFCRNLNGSNNQMLLSFSMFHKQYFMATKLATHSLKLYISIKIAQ